MNNINTIRSMSFFTGFVFFTLLQYIIPSRKFSKDRWQYMLSNLLLVGINNILIILLPIIPYKAAVLSLEKSFGLLNNINFFNVIEVIIGILILDIAIYFQHRLFHKVDFLWNFHLVHHIDPLLDSTSGIRFHPIEIIISNFIKVGIIFVIGISPLSVIIFEIALNLLALFNHSNIKINYKIEKVLNKILITPAIHTIHHSKIFKETNSNYGFSVPWWDMLFNTFLSKGKYTQENIHIGVINMPNKKFQIFPLFLIYPFIKSSK